MRQYKPRVNGKSLNPFSLERQRDKLARDGRFDELRETYKRNLPSIRNVNTTNFWDKKMKTTVEELAGSSIYKDKIKIVTDFLSRKRGRILDIGFGSGEAERALSRRKNHLRVWGIDLSVKAVRQARRNLEGHFVTGKAFPLPYKSCFFDYVLALDVLEHISPWEVFRTCLEIKRVLKKGGKFILSVPLNEGLEEMIAKGKNPNGHVRIYTQDLLIAELKLGGFTIIGQKQLYAFRDFYFLKKMVVSIVKGLKSPNLLIVFAQK